MNKLVLALIIIGIIVFTILIIVFITTQCEEVKAVTLKVPIDLQKKSITLEITKECVIQIDTYSIPQSDIVKLKALKVELLRTNHGISTLEKEIPKLEQDISSMLEIPEDKLSIWHKDYLVKIKRELEIKKSTYQYGKRWEPQGAL